MEGATVPPVVKTEKKYVKETSINWNIWNSF